MAHDDTARAGFHWGKLAAKAVVCVLGFVGLVWAAAIAAWIDRAMPDDAPEQTASWLTKALRLVDTWASQNYVWFMTVFALATFLIARLARRPSQTVALVPEPKPDWTQASTLLVEDQVDGARALLRDAVLAATQIKERPDLALPTFLKWQTKASILGHQALRGERADELDAALGTASTNHTLTDRVRWVAQSIDGVRTRIVESDVRPSFDPTKTRWHQIRIGSDEWEDSDSPDLPEGPLRPGRIDPAIFRDAINRGITDCRKHVLEMHGRREDGADLLLYLADMLTTGLQDHEIASYIAHKLKASAFPFGDVANQLIAKWRQAGFVEPTECSVLSGKPVATFTKYRLTVDGIEAVRRLRHAASTHPLLK